jgi:hypothetical protein
MGRDRKIEISLRHEGPNSADANPGIFELHIPSLVLQKIVQDFTLSGRWWNAYPVDKIEHILRFYKIIPEKMFYRELVPGDPREPGGGHYNRDVAVFGMQNSDFALLNHPEDYPVFKAAKSLPSHIQKRLPSGNRP